VLYQLSYAGATTGAKLEHLARAWSSIGPQFTEIARASGRRGRSGVVGSERFNREVPIQPTNELNDQPLVIEAQAAGVHGAETLKPAVVERVMRTAAEKADAAHHRIPQFYLKRFSGKAGTLQVVDPSTGATQLLLPKEAFAEEGYYTGRLGEDQEPLALAEVLYESIEVAAAPAIRRLTKGVSPAELSLDERGKIAEFLASQMTRGESFKRTTDDWIDEVSKMMLKMKAAHAGDTWPQFLKSLDEPEDLMTADEFIESIDEGSFTVHPSAEQLLNLRLVAVEEMAGIFVQMSWHCVRFDDPCLFTSEEPVTYWREPSPGSEFLGIGAATTDEVRIALSPRLALVLVHPRWSFANGQMRGTREEAALLNFGNLIFRSGFPIVRSPDVAYHPLPRSMFRNSRFMPPFLGGPVVR
jgi:hypothetical protein